MNIFINEVFAQHPSPTPQIQNEFGFGVYQSLGFFTTKLIPLAFTIAAMMIVFYFIIAAIELINSQGDKAHIVSARAKIYHAIIGLILLLLLFFVVQFILDTFGLITLGII